MSFSNPFRKFYEASFTGPVQPITSKPYSFLERVDENVLIQSVDPAILDVEGQRLVRESDNASFLLNNVSGYTPVVPAAQNTSTTTNGGGAGSSAAANPLTQNPTDARLMFIPGDASVDDQGNFSTLLSMDATANVPLLDGFMVPTDPKNPGSGLIFAHNVPDKSTLGMIGETNAGVPSLMNPNAYITFQAFKGPKKDNYYHRLFDQENQPRWYEVDEANAQRNGRYKTPTVTELVQWSQEGTHADLQPYRFQDFAYCKYWQLIPNNYLLTLRRYPYPVIDNLQIDGQSEPNKGLSDTEKRAIRPVATTVTWMGDSPGNKLSTIMGPIETGLNWKDVEGEVNTVSPATPADAGAGPFPGVGKFLGLITGSAQGGDDKNSGTPPDPYTEGPWNNKVLGGVNVINKTKARARGLKFTHAISLVFEYSARSIGGINTKAAMLDIIANLMMMTSASAPFWGGVNRFSPGAPGNTSPFLGGPAGRAAWAKGDPVGFFDAVTTQFASAASAISDFLFRAGENPLEALKSLAAGGAKAFMKENSGSKGGVVSGLKAILTGDPVGEWHLTVGNPMNPMMMIGNLICTGLKLEFGDELGPDDFPTELKATITLEHGMPRDRDAIESMFNAGSGRLYSLPPGYEEGISANKISAVDKYTQRPGNKKKDSGGKGNTGTTKPGGPVSRRGKGILNGDPADVDRAINSVTRKGKSLYSDIAAKWSHGFTKGPLAKK